MWMESEGMLCISLLCFICLTSDDVKLLDHLLPVGKLPFHLILKIICRTNSKHRLELELEIKCLCSKCHRSKRLILYDIISLIYVIKIHLNLRNKQSTSMFGWRFKALTITQCSEVVAQASPLQGAVLKLKQQSSNGTPRPHMNSTGMSQHTQRDQI